MKKLLALYTAYKQPILYLFFGGCTTLINIIFYYVLYHLCSVGNVPSTILAWVVSVLFAFVTNKLFVFESKRRDRSGALAELMSFFGFRILTGILDVAIMAFAVDLMGWNGLLWKIISNVIVIILNYIASKFVVFKKQA